MELTDDYINSAFRSRGHFQFEYRAERLKVLQVWKCFTIGSVLIHFRHIWNSEYLISFQSFLPLIFHAIRKLNFFFFIFCFQIVPYNETMAESQLGFNAFHTISHVPEDLPPDYVVVQYTSPIGQHTMQIGLHRSFVYHLMGRVPREIIGLQTRQYLDFLSAFQKDGIMARGEEEENEESPDR
jgi:hypothetical protein